MLWEVGFRWQLARLTRRNTLASVGLPRAYSLLGLFFPPIPSQYANPPGVADPTRRERPYFRT